MTQSEFIEKLSLHDTIWSKKQVGIVVMAFLEIIQEALQKGDKVEIRGFGRFSVRHRRKRNARNPKTGASAPVSDKRVPFFKAGNELKAMINRSE